MTYLKVRLSGQLGTFYSNYLSAEVYAHTGQPISLIGAIHSYASFLHCFTTCNKPTAFKGTHIQICFADSSTELIQTVYMLLSRAVKGGRLIATPRERSKCGFCGQRPKFVAIACGSDISEVRWR